jgi:glutathione S-transferase
VLVSDFDVCTTKYDGDDSYLMICPAIKLYMSRMCPFSHRVQMTLNEMGLKHEDMEVDMKNKPAELLKINPEGKLPTMLYGDRSFIESSLIMDYLAHQFSDCR